jgi:branched-chain amino acid transport system ATP-binding protein
MTITDLAETPPAPDGGSAPALATRGIGVRFAGTVALRDVSIEARRGQVLGLIGPNGAGKTTLFDAVSGIRQPDAGTIEFEGEDVTRRSAVWRARAGLRRTFQRQQVFGRLTVEENLLCATEWRGGGGGILADLVASPTRRRLEARRRAEVAEVLELCGLTDVRRTLAGSLPIGTARMVELGRALAESPRILLLDEPTSGLGEAEVARLSAALRHLHDAQRCAVVLVEHDITFVMEHSDRVVVLQRGEVLAEGSTTEIQANAQVREAYLG